MDADRVSAVSEMPKSNPNVSQVDAAILDEQYALA